MTTVVQGAGVRTTRRCRTTSIMSRLVENILFISDHTNLRHFVVFYILSVYKMLMNLFFIYLVFQYIAIYCCKREQIR